MAKKSTAPGLVNLKKQLSDGTFANLYVFFGEEDFLKSYYFNTLKNKIVDEAFEDFNYTVFEDAKPDTDQISDALETPPMMAEKKMVVLKYSGIFSKATESMKEYWMKAFDRLNECTVLVFYEESVDKRSALYKAADKAGEMVECAKMEGIELYNWIGRGCRAAGKTIGQKEMEYLVHACDGGMNNIKRELEKLFAYCEQRITVNDIDKIVTKMPQSKVFDMVNAMMRGDGGEVFRLLEDMKTLKESAFMVLSMLYSNFEKLLKTKIMLSESATPVQIASAIKVPPFYIDSYISAVKKMDKMFLIESAKKIAETDFLIKQGRVDEWGGVESFISEFMRGRQK